MQTYRFDLPKLATPRIVNVLASSVQYVRGNAKGFSNAILVSADSTSQRVRMVPGQKMRFQEPVKVLYIENADGEAPIVGELVAGLADFIDSRVIGNLTVSDRDVAAAIEGKNFWRVASKPVALSGVGNQAVFTLRNHENNDCTAVIRRLSFSCKNDAYCRILTGWDSQRDSGGNNTWLNWGDVNHKDGFNSRAYNVAEYEALKAVSLASLYVVTNTFPFVETEVDLWFRQQYHVEKLPRIVEPGRGYTWLINSPGLATSISCDIEWTELTESETEFL